MHDLFPEIRHAVQRIKDAELKAFEGGILLGLQGRTDEEAFRVRSEYYDQREVRLDGLRELLNRALPAGIDAGFSGEWVVERLEALMASVEEAAYWDTTCHAGHGIEESNHFNELFGQVRANLEPLRLMARAAAARSPRDDDWRPASEAVVIANGKGFDITLDWISKRKDRIRTRLPRLPGNHKIEVEMGSLAIALFNEVGRGVGNTDTDEPGMAERAEIESRIQAARERKRQSGE